MSHIREKQNDWKRNNPEAVRGIRQRYAEKNSAKLSQIAKDNERKSRAALGDAYIKRRLRQRLGTTNEDLPDGEELQDLIELQRAAMMLKRVLREIGIFIR